LINARIVARLTGQAEEFGEQESSRFGEQDSSRFGRSTLGWSIFVARWYLGGEEAMEESVGFYRPLLRLKIPVFGVARKSRVAVTILPGLTRLPYRNLQPFSSGGFGKIHRDTLLLSFSHLV
jgi:hypothetical protein